MRTQTLLASIITCAVLALGSGSVAQAADKKADINGTWTFSNPGRGGQGGGNATATPRKSTVKLKADGEKLTGTLTPPAGGRGGGGGTEPTPTEISDGKVKGDEISFSVKREVNGNAFVTKYSGKVEGDTIKGKVERPARGGGDPTSVDWEAKRETEKKETEKK